jgi:hypothetical protein
MTTQIEGIVTVKDEKGKLVAIIYKDGSNAPVLFMVEEAGVEDIVELMGCSLNQVHEQ